VLSRLILKAVLVCCAGKWRLRPNRRRAFARVNGARTRLVNLYQQVGHRQHLIIEVNKTLHRQHLIIEVNKTLHFQERHFQARQRCAGMPPL
jgi:hypothetical protein